MSSSPMGLIQVARLGMAVIFWSGELFAELGWVPPVGVKLRPPQTRVVKATATKKKRRGNSIAQKALPTRRNHPPSEGKRPRTIGSSMPVAVLMIEPSYSEEARREKFQGTVVLKAVVNEKGLPTEIAILGRPLGFGLDEKAIEALNQWRFRPAYIDGEPCKAPIRVEMNFKLI